MATISLCMIVKNEEKVLKRCLDSICDLVDEIIIVDTGSDDKTKEIAREYTNNVYDFEWIDDFSAARNYSFSKCSMDYIYVADADEYLDKAGRRQFKLLKDNIYPEIEIVQMMYETISDDTVLNVFREYRPKLFKRLREFTWINPVHETVRLDPLVFDSDVVVMHAPTSNHSARDLAIFEKEIKANASLSDEQIKMYATELYKNGTMSDFEKAVTYFTDAYGALSSGCACHKDGMQSVDMTCSVDETQFANGVCYVDGMQSADILDSAKGYYGLFINLKYLRMSHSDNFEGYALSVLDYLKMDCSEICFELGEYYLDRKDYNTAAGYYKRAYGGESCIDVHTGGDYALKRLIECSDIINPSMSVVYRQELNNWKMPEESVIN